MPCQFLWPKMMLHINLLLPQISLLNPWIFMLYLYLSLKGFQLFSLQHEERAFVLKFSAVEIYNEVVRDLLSTDNMPLRLLDDPEVS